MKVGAFGNTLIFRVDDRKVLTFKNMKREITGNWASADRMAEKPLPYFQGPALQTITLEITLDAVLGVEPRKLLKRIEKLVEQGQAENLVIGRKKVGKHKWVITKSSEAWDIILQKGELLKATVNLTMQEYF